MNALKIRRYEERDFSAYVGTLEKTTSWGDEAEEELAARIKKMTEKDEIWVAEADAKAVGFMILTPNDDGTLEIDWLDVHPEFQRKGVATSLVERAEGIAKTTKVKALSVHTSVENTKRIAFLKMNGFTVFKRIPDFYGKGCFALQEAITYSRHSYMRTTHDLLSWLGLLTSCSPD